MPRIDSEHRGPLINLAGYITLISMVLITACKIATKWLMVRKLRNDDILMTIALLTAIGHCVAATSETQAGLGQPRKNLTLYQIDQYQKATYVSEIFYILPVYLAKLATVQFFISIARSNEPNVKRIIAKSVFYMLLTWLVVAIVCILFQCGTSYPWKLESGRCFNQLAFWTVNCLLDVASQILIALAPVYLLYDLQLSTGNKRLAYVAFTPNLTTIPLPIMRLVYLFRVSKGLDPSPASFNATMTSVVHVNYSIIASCIPFLKPMIDALSVGLLSNDIHVPIDSDHTTTTLKQKPFNPFGILGAKSANARAPSTGSKYQSSGYSATATATNRNERELSDVERYGSRDRMVINQTKTTTVASKPKKPEPLNYSRP